MQKAAKILARALEQEKNKFTRDAAIQRFEYTYELAWKILKRYLEEITNVKEFSVRNIFREAGKQGIIANVENWLDYHKARNLTSHIYNEKTADETYDYAQKFMLDVGELITALERAIARNN